MKENDQERIPNCIHCTPKQEQPKRQNIQSDSSIIFHQEENEACDLSPVRINEFDYPIKEDSIFEEEEEDYFKKNSEKNIGMNMFNEIGSNNYWP